MCTFYLETRKPRGKKLTQVACGGMENKAKLIEWVFECKKHARENGHNFIYVVTILSDNNKEVIEI